MEGPRRRVTSPSVSASRCHLPMASPQGGAGAIRLRRSGEAAVDHARAIERGVLGTGLHALVGHHLFPALGTRFLARPFDPAVNDALAVLLVRGAGIVGDLAVGDIVRPRFDDARRAIIDEDARHLLRQLAIGFLVGVGHGHDIAVGITGLAVASLGVIDDRVESADDHPLAVERHLAAHLRHARVAHHLLVRGIARRLVGIFEPAENDRLVGLRLHGALEVVDLAVGDIVAPAFDHARDAEFLEQRCRIGGMLAIGFLVRGRHRDHKSFYIGHLVSP